MTEEELYSAFPGRWIQEGNTFLVEISSAVSFAEYALHKGFRILGIEGFVRTSGHVEAPLETILDSREAEVTVVRISQFINEILKMRPDLTHVEFTLWSVREVDPK